MQPDAYLLMYLGVLALVAACQRVAPAAPPPHAGTSARAG
jgi:hypothetical protein